MRRRFTQQFLYFGLAGALFGEIALAQNTQSPSTPAANSPAQTQSAPADQQPARVPGTTPSQQIENQQTPRPTQEQNAQQPASTAQTPTNQQSPRIAPGSVIPVQLTKTVDAKKVKNGDEVVAKVTQDLKSNSTGQVILAKDTKVIGHVTEAQARNKEQKSSELAIAFDHAEMNGNDVQMPMSIQAIIGPPRNNANNSGSASSPDAGMQGNANPNPGASGSGTRPGMGGSTANNMPNTSPEPASSGPTENQSSSTQALPQITASTQGVLGLNGDMRLSTATNNGTGTVVSSEKTNVKLPDGTMMLLRVNQ